jgi:hypothetical protein
MAKKTKLKDLNQIDAKVETARPTSLDQIWGEDGTSKYGTNDPQEYKNYINSLNRTDLQTHAVQIGVLPNDNLEMLRNRLEREFLRHIAAFQAPPSKLQKPKKISKEVQKILSEGR